MPAFITNYRYPLLALALLLMAAATVAGWQFAGLPAATPDEEMHPAPRVAVLPFVDPDTGDFSPFNRALGTAFERALTFAGGDRLVVVGTTTTTRMVAAGMSPADVATRADAAFLLVGGHSEDDHTTFVELWAAPGDRSLLRRDFDLDETRPAHAPPELIEAIVAAVHAASEHTP